MKHLELDGQVILNKLADLSPPDREPADGDVVAAVVDVETTGLNHLKDEIIQIDQCEKLKGILIKIKKNRSLWSQM